MGEIVYAAMSPSLRRSFVLLAITATAMAALLAFLPAAGHDQLWFLLMARRWLGGAQLYGPEIFDSNPPFIIWVSAVPVALAQELHLSATLVAKSSVLLLYAAVATFLHHILPRTWRTPEAGEGPALFFAFMVLACVLPARDFGQRDALAGVLCLPYVLSAAPGSRLSQRARLGAVLLAGSAFCLKPQDGFIALAVELFALRAAWHPSRTGNILDSQHDTKLPSRRKAQPEQRAAQRAPQARQRIATRLAFLLLCGVLYVCAARRYAPLYFSDALPILRNSYWAIGHLSPPALAWEAIELLILTLLTAVLLWRSAKPSSATCTLFAAGLGALAAYLAQGTGWYYQQLPALTLIGAALALHLLGLLQLHPFRPHRVLVPGLATACVLAVVLTTHFMGYPFTTDRAFDLHSPDPAFFEKLPPSSPVAILTTSVDEAMMPVERFHLTWAQRTNNLWLLPAILHTEALSTADPHRRLTPLQLARLRDTQQRWMVEDLRHWQPELVLVERCQDPAVQCQVLEDRHDDLLAWFRRDLNFRQLWQTYRFAGTRERFDAYVRQSEPVKP